MTDHVRIAETLQEKQRFQKATHNRINGLRKYNGGGVLRRFRIVT